MPLLDHFHLALSRTHPWRSFYGAWAAAIARLLNAGVLPSSYYAVPFLDHDGPVEIDVATMNHPENAHSETESDSTKLWTPPAPGLALAVEWPDANDVRVEVLTEDGDPRLAAAVELVSPRNKDRPRAREAFAAKCADYLSRGCGLVVIDVVTSRRADLRSDLLAALDAKHAESGPETLSATSYRPVGNNGEGQLFIWPEKLEISQKLPTLPLWIGAEANVPLDLEASHTAACTDVRIHPSKSVEN